jgi:endonuclease III
MMKISRYFQTIKKCSQDDIIRPSVGSDKDNGNKNSNGDKNGNGNNNGKNIDVITIDDNSIDYKKDEEETIARITTSTASVLSSTMASTTSTSTDPKNKNGYINNSSDDYTVKAVQTNQNLGTGDNQEVEIIIIDDDDNDNDDNNDESVGDVNSNEDIVTNSNHTDIHTSLSTTATSNKSLISQQESDQNDADKISSSSSSLLEQNPFLKFAYHNNIEKQQESENYGNGNDNSFQTKIIKSQPSKKPSSYQSQPKRKIHSMSTATPYTRTEHITAIKDVNEYTTNQTKSNKKQKVKSTNHKTTHNSTRKRTRTKKDKKADIPITQMTKEEKEKCLQKWHSFADEDAPLETQRFQVLIAARLHCQAQDKVVRNAMSLLKEYVTSSTAKLKNDNDNDNNNNITIMNRNNISFLDPETLSSANPNEIAKVISSVLFANVKAKQIVKAAYEVKTLFRGVVPESQHGLKMITGVGPKLADVLQHINCRKDYL